MAEYRLTLAAENDMDAIWLYTHKQWGVEQANEYIDNLTTAFELLAKSPKTAPACDDIRQNYRRKRVERHMVYFYETRYGIRIVRVLHERMNALQLFS